MALLGLKLLVNFVVFGAIFVFAHKKIKKVTIQPWYAVPLVSLVFALLNTGLYFVAKKVLDLASMGAFSYVLPLIVNGLFLYATARLIRPLRLDGIVALVKVTFILSLATGIIRYSFTSFA